MNRGSTRQIALVAVLVATLGCSPSYYGGGGGGGGDDLVDFSLVVTNDGSWDLHWVHYWSECADEWLNGVWYHTLLDTTWGEQEPLPPGQSVEADVRAAGCAAVVVRDSGGWCADYNLGWPAEGSVETISVVDDDLYLEWDSGECGRGFSSE